MIKLKPDEIKAEDVNDDFSKDKEMLDFSNYSAESIYKEHSNKLVLGEVKDEWVVLPSNSLLVESLRFLRFFIFSQIYSLIVVNVEKAKVVNKNCQEYVTINIKTFC